MTISTFPTIGTYLNRVKRRIRLARTHGPGRTAYSAAAWASRRPVLRNIGEICLAELFELPLPQWPTARRGPSCYVVREAVSKDAWALGEYFGNAQLIRERSQQDDVCVIAETGGKIAAAMWLKIGPAVYLEDASSMGCCFHIAEKAVWTYDGKGTRIGAWGTLMSQLPSLVEIHGVERVVTLIESNNWQSLDSHRGWGFQRLGSVASMQVLGKRHIRCRGRDGSWDRLPQSLPPVTVAPVPTW